MNYPNPQAMRAYLHAHGRIWDVMRDLYDAFLVDTGSTGLNSMPSWEDLPFSLQQLFVAANLPMITQLGDITTAIAKQAIS